MSTKRLVQLLYLPRRTKPQEALNKGLCLLACALVLAWAPATTLPAGTCSDSVPATGSFSDRLGDRIYSDNQGVYPGSIYTPSGAFIMAFHNYDAPRTLNFDYTVRLTGTGPTGTDANDANVFWQLANITSVPCDGNFYERSLYIDNSWGSTGRKAGKTRFDGIDGASVGVLVKRSTRWTWTAVAVMIDATSRYDVARLVQTMQGKFVTTGTYSLPFEMTIAADSTHCASSKIPAPGCP